MSKFLNISTDTTLGGNSASDDTVSSQKAVKAYVDSQTGTAPAFANITGQPTDNANLASALNAKYDASNPNGYTSNVGTVTSVNNVSPVNGNVTLSIPAAQVNSDWNASSGVAQILNKPTLGTMASESASDYTPTSGLATVATTGAYSDLSGTPTIPTVNNATLTIQKNGTTVNTFTANASSNVTANITVPTKTSDLTNDDGFITGITSSDVTTALGYTPYDSSNPSGYTDNVGTVTSVNNTSPDSNGNVTISTGGNYTAGTGISIDANNEISVTSPTLTNTATGVEALTIFGVPTNKTYATNIGRFSVAGANASIAIGNQATANGFGCIQLGEGTNNEDKSFYVGTYDNNWKMLGNDGLIPYQRINSITDSNSGSAVKTWTGTKAQYDAIATKDATTLYNITDDTDVTLTLLETLYPVGSIYITTASTCPLSTLINGSTWELVSSGRVLQGADSGHSAGSTIEAGLPNITGKFTLFATYGAGSSEGALNATFAGTTKSPNNVTGTGDMTVNLNASSSSSIYGNSNTVQPPAYIVNIYRRTA